MECVFALPVLSINLALSSRMSKAPLISHRKNIDKLIPELDLEDIYNRARRASTTRKKKQKLSSSTSAVVA
jgi:hypothetical protein